MEVIGVPYAGSLKIISTVIFCTGRRLHIGSIRRFITRYRVLSVQPAAEINLRTARRTEGVVLWLGGLPANRARPAWPEGDWLVHPPVTTGSDLQMRWTG